MVELDEELIARAIRWCADAGRDASAEAVRAALSPLSWDELLSARAILADPPPARPLGPYALADLARGALPDVAAERERAGQYRDEPDSVATIVAPPEPGAAPRPRPRGDAAKKRGGPAAPLIRRARDRVAPATAVPRPSPFVDELMEAEGRAVLERLVRTHGARRAAIVAALAAGWRRRDAAPVAHDDLAPLLEAHGLTRAFERRERDELLHVLRASGGVLGAAAERLGITVDELRSALQRLGAAAQAESIRSAHRAELLRRATLSERVHALLGEAARLRDLELLDEVEEDLRRRLPEHLRALRTSGAAVLGSAVARTLGISPRDLPRLATLLRLDLGVHEALSDTAAPRGAARGAATPRARDARRRSSRPGARPSRPGARPSHPGARPSRPGTRSSRSGPAPRRPPKGR